MKICYPVKKGNNQNLKFNNRFGSYLISNLKTWHGGVHLEELNAKIQAIADGRIIAYRFSEEYKELLKTKDKVTTDQSETEESDSEHFKYSNSFVLIQHDIPLTKEVKDNEGTKQETSKEEKKYVTFYSLYNHLMPIEEYYESGDNEGEKKIKAGIEIPNQFKIITAVVTAEEGYEGTKEKVSGLNARILNPKGEIYPVQKKYIDFVIPTGEKVKKYVNAEGNNEVVQKYYTRVIYTDKNNVTHDNIYINNKKKFVKNLGGEFEIIYTKDKGVFINESEITEEKKKEPKGARVRADKKSNTKILKLIPKGQKVEVLEKTDKHTGRNGKVYWWLKIKGYDSGYSHSSNFDITEGYDDNKITKNDIIACDIPVKAEEHIGYAGLLESELSQGYTACQLDVFMTEEAQEFINNDFGAGTTQQHYAIIPEGTTLKKSITTTVDLKKGVPVEVINTNGIYVQIKESYKEVEATVPKKLLKKYHPVDGPDYYTIDSSNLDKLNIYYNNKLPDSNVKLYWVSRAKEDGTKITKDREKTLIKNATTKKQNYTPYRKLKYVPKNNPQTYWVAVKDLFPVTKIVTKTITIKKPLSVAEIATSFLDYFTRPECREEPETYQIKYPCPETAPAKKGDRTKLNTHITTAYIAVPDNETDIDQEVCKNALIDIRKTKKIKQDTGKEWIQVSCSYPLGNTTVTKKGWIENKDIELFSAYNWDKFGFKAFEAGSEYIYDIIGLRENKETESPFIKKLWDTLDVNNNEIIDLFEIEYAYRILEVQQAIAKMVCRHKSEWAYEPQQIIDEISVFYDYRISKQKPSIQNALEALKEEKLEGIKGQLEKLMFWDEASGLTYTVPPPPPDPEAKKKPGNKRTFGTDTIDQSLFEPLSIPKNTGNTNDYSLPSVPDMDTDLLVHTKTKTATPTTTGTPPVVEEKKAVPQEVKPPERTFPCTDNVWHFHPIAFINQMRLIYGVGAESNSEAKIRAFMRLIKEFEGVPGKKGYTTLFGKKDFFSDMSTHPEKPIYWYTKDDGTKVHSTAAGSYQIMKVTWWDYNGEVVKKGKKTGEKNKNRNFVKKYEIKDFSPKSQDEFCIALLKHARPPKGKQKGLLNDLLNGYVTRAIESYASFIWASFTPGRFENQGPTKGITDKQEKRNAIHKARIKQLKLYDKFLAEELEGTTDLHLEAGFLKKFGIKEPEPLELIENKKKGLDLNKVLIGLNKRAAAVELPIGKCAKYVRLALEDGGMSTNGRPNAAADYVSFLPKKGFKEVEVSDGDYQKGDIAVFERFQGIKRYHKYGHIQIYNGEKWVSDFFQTDFWAGNDYRVKEPNHKIYRWE